MSASSPFALLMLIVLAGTASAAESPRLPDCNATQERIDLPAEPDGKVYEVCISPGLATSWRFDSPLRPKSVVLNADGQDVLMAQGERIITLLPSEKLIPGERLKLMVLFADDEAPASVAFILVVHPARAARQIEVFRQKRTLASYQQAEKEKEAQVQQCRKENARLRAECGGPRGLTGLLASGLMDEDGVAPRNLTGSVTRHPASAFAVAKVFSYRSKGMVAVVLVLEVPKGAVLWEAVGAELLGPGGRTLRVLSPWQAEPIKFAAEDRRVIIEAEATEAETRGTFTLKVWDASGTRSIILRGVTFP
jgi:uncharacterized protein (TIGR02268 family)